MMTASGAFFRHAFNDRLEALGDVLGVVGIAGAEVVGAALEDDDFRIHAVELAIFHPPEDVLHAIGAPAEVGGVPAEEVLLPVGQVFGVGGVRGAPAAGDGIALEVDVDPAQLRLGEEVLVGDPGVVPGLYYGSIGGAGGRTGPRPDARGEGAERQGSRRSVARWTRVSSFERHLPSFHREFIDIDAERGECRMGGQGIQRLLLDLDARLLADDDGGGET